VALLDATKGLAMFRKTNVDILGIIENMSFFLCPHCGERTEVFSHGGGRDTSEKEGVPFLGEIPLNVSIREAGDGGKPLVVSDPESAVGKIFGDIARALAARISIQGFANKDLTEAAKE